MSLSLDAMLVAGFDGVAVVVGDDDFADLVPAGVHTVLSPDWQRGQSHSLQAAAAFASDSGYDAMVIGLADQPLVESATWSAVRMATDTPIAVAAFAGRRRPPVRLSSEVWAELPVGGDTGARDLIASSGDRVTEVPSAGDPSDVDTLESLEEVRQRYLDRIAVRGLLGREPMGACLVYTSPSPRDATLSRMPSSA